MRGKSMSRSVRNQSGINQSSINNTTNMTTDNTGSPLKNVQVKMDKPRFLNLVHPDSFFTQRAPHMFDPGCVYRCSGRHPRDCEKYHKSKNCLPMSPTLEKLNILNYDKMNKMDKLVVKHISEYLP